MPDLPVAAAKALRDDVAAYRANGIIVTGETLRDWELRLTRLAFPDLPVAAPDHAETIRRALAYWSDSSIGSEEEREVHDVALAALDALLAERQQAGEALRLREAALASLDQILFGSSRIRSRDELEMRAQELVVERQQDKERTAEYQLRARAAVLVLERHGLRDEYLQAVADQRDAAALAVEEDA